MPRTYPTPATPTCHPDRDHHAKGLCRLCYFQTYMRKYRADGRHLAFEEVNRERYKHYRRKRRYGLTREQYEAMFAEQAGGCAICGRTEKRLVVDHGHADNRVRGLLCDMCNHAIGYLENYIPSVGSEKFTAYLTR